MGRVRPRNRLQVSEVGVSVGRVHKENLRTVIVTSSTRKRHVQRIEKSTALWQGERALCSPPKGSGCAIVVGSR
jgi:hypothetical protein